MACSLLLRNFYAISSLDPGLCGPWDISPHSTQNFTKFHLRHVVIVSIEEQVSHLLLVTLLG